MILFVTSFVAGVLTVLAPCILPLLPVIVGGSLQGGAKWKRALTVTGSLALSVIVFTLLLKASTLLISIPDYFWKYTSGGIVLVLGVITVFPSLWERIPFVGKLSRGSNKVVGQGFQKKSIWGDVLIGAALGPVFSTCSPTYFLILATVLPETPLVGFLYLLTYAVGLSLALLVIAFIGQRVITKLGVAGDPHGWFKKTLGVIFILVGLAIVTGFDKQVETKILDAGFFDITKLEQKILERSDQKEKEKSSAGDVTGGVEDVKQESAASAMSSDAVNEYMTTEEKAKQFSKAKELVAPAGFINTDGLPITLSQYVGKKVILLDVWTYSCINCQRTLPYITGWFNEYEDDGLIVVGVHTPEFAFEKVQSNVEQAVEDFGIRYPVILDNEYATWNAYGNRYWPRKYLIDIDGFVVYDHIGEGAYAETEAKIVEALKERAAKLGLAQNIDTVTVAANLTETKTPNSLLTPEIYFGADRNRSYLGNGVSGKVGEQTFTKPSKPILNRLYLSGMWSIKEEFAQSSEVDGSILLTYAAQHVYMVASGVNARVGIYNDGQKIKTITIDGHKLYDIIDLAEYGTGTLEIKVEEGTIDVYTFTFG